MIVQLYADIAIIGGNHTAVVDAAADIQYLFFDLIFTGHQKNLLM